MPIRFRCSYCNRLLGIATRKAGMQTTCPHCGNSITVPATGRVAEKTARINVEDVDELLGKSAVATAKSPVAAPPAPPPVPPPVLPPVPPPVLPPPPPQPEVLEPEFEEPPVPAKRSAARLQTSQPPPAQAPRPKPPREYDPDDPPLFEGDVDEILGNTATPDEEPHVTRPPATGMDAMSLGITESRPITLSSQAATLLMVAVVVLMALSFVAGYLIAPRG